MNKADKPYWNQTRSFGPPVPKASCAEDFYEGESISLEFWLYFSSEQILITFQNFQINMLIDFVLVQKKKKNIVNSLFIIKELQTSFLDVR